MVFNLGGGKTVCFQPTDWLVKLFINKQKQQKNPMDWSEWVPGASGAQEQEEEGKGGNE